MINRKVHSTAWLTALILLSFSSVSLGESADTQFVDGLRERRLYRLVDLFCEDRWANANLSERQLAEVTASWLRAGTQCALESSPQDRPQRWDQADRIAASFRQRAAESPFALLVTTQLALSNLAQVELAREEADGGLGTKQTLDSFRSAIRLLKSAEIQSSELLRQSYQRGPDAMSDDSWTANQLESIGRHLQVEIARAFRRQALCYAAASEDRTNSLSQALETLQPIVSRTSREALIWQARVEQVVCLRLLERNADARAQLARWEQEQPPPGMQSRFVGEKLRLDVAEGTFDRALDSAREMIRRATITRAPETDATILEILLAARKKANDAQIGQLTSEAAELTTQIAARHGPYWKRRADAALGRALAEDSSTDDPELVVRAAESLYAAGRWKDAVSAYDRASAQFLQAGDDHRHLETAATAAAIVRQAGDLAEAAKRFRHAALKNPKHPRAPELHLTAAGMVAKLARSRAPNQQPPAPEQFSRLLREHLQLWPASPQAGMARWWLARQLISRHQWSEAIELLAEIDPSSEHFGESVVATLACYRQALSLLETNSPDDIAARRRITAQATRQLQPIITGTDNRWPQRWSPLQRTVATSIAHLQLLHAPRGSEYTEKLLTAALADSTASEPAWKARAGALLAAAMIRNGHTEKGTQGLRTVFSGNQPAVENLLIFLETLQLGSDTDRNPKPELATVVLEFAGRAKGNARWMADESVAAKLAHYLGLAHQHLGHRQEALDAYRQWTEMQPQEGDAHEAYATMLGRGSDPKELHKALAIWQQVERRSQAGGPRWLRGRKHRLRLLAQLGQVQQADKLLQITLVLYPHFDADLPRNSPTRKP